MPSSGRVVIPHEISGKSGVAINLIRGRCVITEIKYALHSDDRTIRRGGNVVHDRAAFLAVDAKPHANPSSVIALRHETADSIERRLICADVEGRTEIANS